MNGALGDLTLLVATAYFAGFIALHVAAIIAGRRLDATPPKDSGRRVRYARALGWLQAAKAGWFAVLFTVSAITVVEATPALPLLEVIVVYGGLIGIVVSLMQAAEWFQTAHRTRRAAATLESLTVLGGEVVTTPDNVTVYIPRDLLDRIITGGHLSPEDADTLRAAHTESRP